jgi:hypothetical protein
MDWMYPNLTLAWEYLGWKRKNYSTKSVHFLVKWNKPYG